MSSVRCCRVLGLLLCLLCFQGKLGLAATPRTGLAVPGMESYDTMIEGLLKQYKVPGAAVAVTKNGRLVFSRGYGYSDVEKKEAVQPDALFRVASISKPVTAVAVLRLVEQGKLKLSDKAFSFLKHLQPAPGKSVHAKLKDITIQQLLYHSAGWDRKKSFDPMFRPATAAAVVKAQAPASCETVIRYMMSRQLDFASGTRYAYSNFGYCILGRVIEKVTGQSYEKYVRQFVLKPMGIQRMQIGATRLKGRAPGEVKYYHYPGGSLARSVFPADSKLVPWPYGGFYLEAMDAHGGWIASPIDLVRFINAVDHRPNYPDFLQSATIKQMVARPAPPLWKGTSYYYGMGWLVRPSGSDANWWHNGSLPGTASLMVRTHHGYAWAVLYNSRPKESNFFSAIDSGMWRAFRGVTQWPSHDLFAGSRPPEPSSDSPAQEATEPQKENNSPPEKPTPPEPTREASSQDAASQETTNNESTTPETIVREEIGEKTDKSVVVDVIGDDNSEGSEQPQAGACSCSEGGGASLFTLFFFVLGLLYSRHKNHGVSPK